MNTKNYRISLNNNDGWIETRLSEDDIQSIIGTSEQFVEVYDNSNHRCIIPISSIQLILEMKS